MGTLKRILSVVAVAASLVTVGPARASLTTSEAEQIRGYVATDAHADRVRAQLALQGVESKVQKVSVDNDTWHRIRIGPISKLDELNRLRTILRKADVDVLVIRVGD